MGVAVGISPSRLVRENWNGGATRRWKSDDTITHFDTTHERDTHTHTHTHTHIQTDTA